MREYKFRGKRLDNGKWVYGSLYGAQYQETGKVGIMTTEQAGDVAIIDEVFSQTVGQYAGLKDKKGQDIYEGDIMRYNNVPPTYCAVFWDKDAAQFAIEQEEFGVVRRDWVDKRGEVIGNIHENPELLEGK